MKHPVIDVPDRTVSPWMWFLARLAQVQRPDPVPSGGTADELRAWQRRAARRLKQLIGPRPEPVDPAVRTEEPVDCDGYTRTRLRWMTERNAEVTGWLLVPTSRKRPGSAVLALHGHGPGADEIVGLADTADHGDAFAHELARRGHVVLAPDSRGFGGRADWQPPNIYHCDYELTLATMLGTTPLARNLHDYRVALDILGDHPLVKASRIGACGLSFGGTATLFLAASDKRVRAAVVSGYFSSFASSAAVPWNMCGSQVLPGVIGELEHIDLAALVAPRALLIETGSEDGIFSQEVAIEEHAALQQVYRTLGGATAIDAFTGGHMWSGRLSYDFLAEQLSG